jgi:hypothetical protein
VKLAQPVAITVTLALSSAECLAWGRDGHQVIANLAQSRLSPTAKKGVAALLRGATLASVASEADNLRNSRPETARWHYVNIPLTATAYDAARDCQPSPQGDCILAAIDRFAAILADRAKPDAARAEALTFLVHLIADLHNPMHVTTNNDRGGNETKVAFFGTPTNLHALWDVGLMEHTGLTITAWTDTLNRSGQTVPAGGTPVQWALEALRVAREHCYQLPPTMRSGRRMSMRTVPCCSYSCIALAFASPPP